MLPLIIGPGKSSSKLTRLEWPAPASLPHTAGMWNLLERIYFQLAGMFSKALIVLSLLMRVPKLSDLEEF